MRVFVADEYRHGRLPLWDPYTFSGEPAVSKAPAGEIDSRCGGA
jgi:hypothetical protein